MSWQYQEKPAAKFPEVFSTKGRNGRYEVYVNRVTEKLKVTYTSDGFSAEAFIMEGDLIQCSASPQKSEAYIKHFFLLARKRFRNINDKQVIELFNGHFGVIPKKKLRDYLPKFKLQKNSDWFHLYELCQPLIKTLVFIINLPKTILRLLSQRPALADFADLSFVCAASYLIFQLNFNFVHGGAAAAIGAIGSGISDQYIRERNPHLLKVLIPFLLGFYLLNLGIRHQ